MMPEGIKIAPSMLSADFGQLLDEIRNIEKDAHLLHIDIMDGHFVPNISFGLGVLESLRGKVGLPFDVHLMVEYPERWIEPFADVGCEFISFHSEVAPHADRIISLIKKKGVKAGVALNPATPEDVLRYILSKLDMVLVMSVNPGFGGQQFIPEVLPKISSIRRAAHQRNLNLDIAVDGGINQDTARKVVNEGANILVMGSFLFNHPEPEKLIGSLRNELKS